MSKALVNIPEEPQFRDLTFKSVEERRLWVNENSSFIIHLANLDGPLSTLWVHKTGEILNTDYKQSIYVGRFINTDIEILKPANHVFMWSSLLEEWMEREEFLIESIHYIVQTPKIKI